MYTYQHNNICSTLLYTHRYILFTIDNITSQASFAKYQGMYTTEVLVQYVLVNRAEIAMLAVKSQVPHLVLVKVSVVILLRAAYLQAVRANVTAFGFGQNKAVNKLHVVGRHVLVVALVRALVTLVPLHLPTRFYLVFFEGVFVAEKSVAIGTLSPFGPVLPPHGQLEAVINAGAEFTLIIAVTPNWLSIALVRVMT